MMRAAGRVGRGCGALPLLLALLAACDGESTAPDAGLDGSTDAAASAVAPDIPWLADGVPPIAPPEIPWLADGAPAIAPPLLTPCPSGWREVPPDSADGVATCDPYPAAGPATCPMGSAHFPGEPACAPVGSACPTGEWADDLPATGVVHVRAGEPAGGDGSRTSPFARVMDALAVVGSGGTVAIARGTYDEAVVVSQPTILRGACAAETLLTTSNASAAAVIDARASDVVVRDLRVGESPVPGLAVRSAGWSMQVDGVIVDRATHLGVQVVGGALSGRSFVVRDTSHLPDGTSGWGLDADEGASIELARALLQRNRAIGVFARGAGTTVRLEDTVVRETRSRESTGTGGHGLIANMGASVELVRALFERNRSLGVYVSGIGAGETSARLEDTIIRGTLSRGIDGLFGGGLEVVAGASAEVRRSLFELNHDHGVSAGGRGTTLELRDVVVRDTHGEQSDGSGGEGLAARAGASVDVARSSFESNRFAGVAVVGAGTTLRIEDAVVRDTRGEESDTASDIGLFVVDGASAQVARAVIERNGESGVFVFGPGSTLRLEDTVVRDTQGKALNGYLGRGLSLQEGASAEVTRGLFERNRDMGVSVEGTDSSLRLEDTVVRDTRVEESNGVGGQGIYAQAGASLEVARTLVEGNHWVGIMANSIGTTVLLEDTVVRDTQGVDGRFGQGLNLFAGASAEATRALFERNGDISVLVAGRGTTLRLEDTVVRETRSRESDGSFGRGLSVQDRANVNVTRGLFERNREVGVYASNPGTRVVLEDTVVRDTLPAECGESCELGAGGIGAGSYEEATLIVDRFAIERSALCGVQVAFLGVLELYRGEVSESEIGACVQVASYPLSLLQNSVVYRDNVANIEATTFPTPMPGELAMEP